MNRFIRQTGKTETELDPKTCKTVSHALTNDAMGLSVFAIFNFLFYAFMTNLADPQFLYIDLFLITPFAIFMSANKAYEKIAIKR